MDMRNMTPEEKALAQAQHRLEAMQARNRVKEQKARTRRLIQRGAILVSCGIVFCYMVSGFAIYYPDSVDVDSGPCTNGGVEGLYESVFCWNQTI